MGAFEDYVQNFLRGLRTVGGLAPLHGTSNGPTGDGLLSSRAEPAFASANTSRIAEGQNPSADAGEAGNGATNADGHLVGRHKRKSKRAATELGCTSTRRTKSEVLSAEEVDERNEPKRALTVNEAVRLYSISRSSIYLLIKAGKLPDVVVGGRRLLPRDAMEALIAGKRP